MRSFRRRVPEVSIVTPYLNAQPTLERAIESVLSQSLAQWELLLVDDGSTDGSVEAARRYAREYPNKIRCLRHPGGAHRGTFASRILGARKSSAPVIAFLDADDLWDRDYLAFHLRFWKRHDRRGVALSYGPAYHWFPGDPSGRHDFVQTLPSRKDAIFAPGELLQNFLSGNFAGAPKPSCCLVRRDDFLELASFSDAARRSASVEDWFLAWGIGARWPIAMHTRPLVRYRRKHPVGMLPADAVRKSLQHELLALRVIRSDLSRRIPDHPLLDAEGIPARLKRLRRFRRLPTFGDYFIKRIPEDLLRQSHARQSRSVSRARW